MIRYYEDELVGFIVKSYNRITLKHNKYEEIFIRHGPLLHKHVYCCSDRLYHTDRIKVSY